MSKSSEKRERDDCSLYGELLASKLRSLDENMRQYAMLEVDKILFQIKQQSSIPYSPYMNSSSSSNLHPYNTAQMYQPSSTHITPYLFQSQNVQNLYHQTIFHYITIQLRLQPHILRHILQHHQSIKPPQKIMYHFLILIHWLQSTFIHHIPNHH